MVSELLFSVVIPTYNRADTLLVTLNSVICQTYPNFEIIVVDDGSTDNTQSVVANIKDDRLKYVRIENSERAAARNVGIQSSKASYITFLDSDDVLFRNHLEVAHAHLVANRRPEVYHQAYAIQDGNVLKKKWTSFGEKDINTALVTIGNVMSCMGVFIRKDVISDIKFNEDRDLSGFEDWELWIRLAARYPIIYNPEITSALVQHSGRSVSDISTQKMKNRVDRLIQYAFNDESIQTRFSAYRTRFKALVLSYASLHFSSSSKMRDKVSAVKYFLLAIRSYPLHLLTRRTLIIMRNLMIRWAGAAPIFLYAQTIFTIQNP